MIEIENVSDAELVNAFKKMSDMQLHASAVRMAEKERRVTLSLLRHLIEIERRHLFSRFSVSSLHGYCVKELKMCEATAGRRVSAARLLREIPVIEEKILSGSVNLTSVAQAGVFFRKEELSGNKFSVEEKRELVLKLEDKSTREVEVLLLSNSDQPEIHFKEKIAPKSESMAEVRLLLDSETMAALERLQEIWSNANPHASLADIIKRAAVEAVEKHDPLKKIDRANERAAKKISIIQKFPETASSEFTPAPESQMSSMNLRNITLSQVDAVGVQAKIKLSKAEIRRAVWARDGARCTFVDPRTGCQCEARHFLEEDHIEPKAMGGEYSVENIRLRCRAHNQRHAMECFRAEKVRRYF